MLQLRPEQMEAFENYMRQRFEKKMLAHLRRTFPTRLADTTDDQLRQLISEGIQHAESHDITLEDDVRRFLEAAVILGPDFHTQAAWAAEILRDDALDATEKMNRIEAHDAYKAARQP